MSSSASPAPSRRKTLLSLGVLALLTGIVVFIFREHWAEISEALSRLTLGQGLLALAVGLSYPLLEGVSSWLIVRSRLPHFPLRQGIDNAWMGTFGNVVGLGAGSVPFQTWYLHRRGLDVGPGVGLMTLQYVFHKTAVLLYATVLLLAGAASHVADPLRLQRPAQRGGHGFGGDGLPAGVQQLPPRCFVHEPADVLPAGQLLRRLCGKRRRLCAGAAAAKPRMTL